MKFGTQNGVLVLILSMVCIEMVWGKIQNMYVYSTVEGMKYVSAGAESATFIIYNSTPGANSAYNMFYNLTTNSGVEISLPRQWTVTTWK